MFLDGRALPDNSSFRADLVIVGAGAAGITIADRKTFANAGFQNLTPYKYQL